MKECYKIYVRKERYGQEECIGLAWATEEQAKEAAWEYVEDEGYFSACVCLRQSILTPIWSVTEDDTL